MNLVLFDIDGTLVRGPSTERRFARFLWREGYIGVRQVLAFLWFTLRYFPVFGSGVFRKNKAYLSGLSESHLRELADDFVRHTVDHAMFEPACARVRRHLQRGDDVWLLSGTLDCIAESIARLLRLDQVLASRCQITEGKVRARPPLQHPYGRSKLSIAEELCRQHGVPLDEVVAYGDSWADRDLLAAVGKAVAVLPDKRLRALAASRGWEVMDEPSATAVEPGRNSGG